MCPYLRKGKSRTKEHRMKRVWNQIVRWFVKQEWSMGLKEENVWIRKGSG